MGSAPECLLHSINQCNLSGNRTCNCSMRGNHLAYAATQGIKSTIYLKTLHCFQQFSCKFIHSFHKPHYYIPCGLVVSYAFFILIPKYIFPFHWLLFTHLPNSKHFIHVPSTLPKPILLLPYFTFSSSCNFFNQHSSIHLTKYTKKLMPLELLHSYLSHSPLNRGSCMHHPFHRYDPHIRTRI